MADDLIDLERQIEKLEENFAVQIENCFIALEKTLEWYEDIIFRCIENLFIVIESYEIFIDQRISQLGMRLVDARNFDPVAGTGTINFDVERIDFDFLSLIAQILQHEIIIIKTEFRMEEAIEAIDLGVEEMIKWYENAIEAKEDEIKQREAFEANEESSEDILENAEDLLI